MKKHTYFDTTFVPRASQYFAGFPWDDKESANVHPMEVTIFDDVLSHEHFLYEQRGAIALPKGMSVKWNTPKYEIPLPSGVKRVFSEPNVHPIPIFHDSQQVTISASAVRPSRIIFLSGFNAWNALVTADFHNTKNSVIVCGSGLPRFGVRKLLSIIAKRLRLDVIVFADGDSWGAFICSMLLRGTLVPGESQPLLSVKKVVFGGVTREDIDGPLSEIRRALHTVHSLRVSAMKSYQCFKSRYWQDTLNDMLSMNACVGLEHAAEYLGKRAFCQYVSKRIDSLGK